MNKTVLQIALFISFFFLCNLELFSQMMMASDAAMYILRQQSKAHNENGVYGVSEKTCESESELMMKSLEEFERTTGHPVIYDTEDFWAKRKMWSDNTAYRYYKFGKYIGKEDGYCEPYRTNYEVELYNNIKSWIEKRKPDESLTMQQMLSLGLKSCVGPDNKVNVQETLLTIHNVVRLLARPKQWTGYMDGDYGHPKTDPIYPILQDIKGIESTKGKTLAELMFNKGNKYSKSMRAELATEWTNDLFSNGKAGIFEMREGAKLAPKAMETTDDKSASVAVATWNGGCHYYYWMGALARTTMTSLSVSYGANTEEEAKWEQSFKTKGTDLQGITEVSHLYCGSTFGGAIINRKNEPIHVEPVQAPPVQIDPSGEVQVSNFTGIYAAMDTYAGNAKDVVQVTQKNKAIDIKMINSGISIFSNFYGSLAEVEPELDYTKEYRGKLVYFHADDSNKRPYMLETIIRFSTVESREYGNMKILMKGHINHFENGMPGPPNNDWNNLWYKKK